MSPKSATEKRKYGYSVESRREDGAYAGLYVSIYTPRHKWHESDPDKWERLITLQAIATAETTDSTGLHPPQSYDAIPAYFDIRQSQRDGKTYSGWFCLHIHDAGQWEIDAQVAAVVELSALLKRASVIEDKFNLRHRYPHCQVTPLIAAFNRLGLSYVCKDNNGWDWTTADDDAIPYVIRNCK